MAIASRENVREVAGRLGKSLRTIWYWIAEGCDIGDEESIRQFGKAKQRRKTNIQKSRERRAAFGVVDCGPQKRRMTDHTCWGK
jgi:hypothetical protein